MWEAVADYADGTSVHRLFEDDPNKSDIDQQYEIEAWLMERDVECVYCSVVFINEEV